MAVTTPEDAQRLSDAMGRYAFNEIANTLYDFVWRDVCDRYLEAVKPTVDDDLLPWNVDRKKILFAALGDVP